MGRAYSKAESVSKSVDTSGSFVLVSGLAVSGSVAGASTEGEAVFDGETRCFPKKQHGTSKSV